MSSDFIIFNLVFHILMCQNSNCLELQRITPQRKGDPREVAVFGTVLVECLWCFNQTELG